MIVTGFHDLYPCVMGPTHTAEHFVAFCFVAMGFKLALNMYRNVSDYDYIYIYTRKTVPLL